MMTPNSPNRLSEPPSLLSAVLAEIVAAQGSQAIVDELGLAIASHVGLKRQRNEDRAVVVRLIAPNKEMYTVAIVCDGVGGSEFGDQAAALAIASVISDLVLQRGRLSLNELATSLVRHADDVVRKQLRGRGTTTLVMLLGVASGNFVCANVGDSRAYSWNPSSKKLLQITTDDTIENELIGLPDKGEALIKARGLQGRLSQAIGEGGRTADELRVQICTEEQFPSGAVLGSDGLWRAAGDFETLVANATTPTEAVRRAITLANWVGGVDNSSMIAIEDVYQFCGSRLVYDSDNQNIGFDLWLPSAKVKFLTNTWISDSSSTSPGAKSEKPKAKSRRKEPQISKEEGQLELDAVDQNRHRPKIEIVVSDEPNKKK